MAMSHEDLSAKVLEIAALAAIYGLDSLTLVSCCETDLLIVEMQ